MKFFLDISSIGCYNIKAKTKQEPSSPGGNRPAWVNRTGGAARCPVFVRGWILSALIFLEVLHHREHTEFDQ